MRVVKKIGFGGEVEVGYWGWIVVFWSFREFVWWALRVGFVFGVRSRKLRVIFEKFGEVSVERGLRFGYFLVV